MDLQVNRLINACEVVLDRRLHIVKGRLHDQKTGQKELIQIEYRRDFRLLTDVLIFSKVFKVKQNKSILSGVIGACWVVLVSVK